MCKNPVSATGGIALATTALLTDDATYYASQTANGCEGLGNGKFSTASFRYHPNPVNKILSLSYDKNISAIEVYNIVGQKVIVKTVNQNQAQIDMSQLATGT